jgi:glycosyltransferase involved in cell wall biosynthesis
MEISVVITVKNEGEQIENFLNSLANQTLGAKKIIVVDGGSTDNTVEKLKKFKEKIPNLNIYIKDGFNISQGRNFAIRNTNTKLIAVTDGGVELKKDWLENLFKSFRLNKNAKVVAGFSLPLCNSWFERTISCLFIPQIREINPKKFMPSSRSIAFKREVWEKVGGYPEDLDVGEDMFFNFRIKNSGYNIIFNPDAIVLWKIRKNILQLFNQYFRYAMGDGIANMYPYRHALRFFVYTFLALLIILFFLTKNFLFLILPLPFAIYYIKKAYIRSIKTFKKEPLWEIFFAWISFPFLQFLIDIAKMAGYIWGLMKRKKVLVILKER